MVNTQRFHYIGCGFDWSFRELGSPMLEKEEKQKVNLRLNGKGAQPKL